ncbi:MAG: TolC family protein [Candidatus Krumholzibacteriia bacterium]
MRVPGRGWTAAAVAAAVLGAAAGAPARAAAAEARLDVAGVLRLAAAQSRPAVIAAADSVGAAAATRRAEAGWYPSLGLDAQYILRDNPVAVGFGSLTFDQMPRRNAQYSLDARELLWDGGRRSLAVTAARRREAAVRAGGVAGVQEAQLGALASYLDVLDLSGSAAVLQQRLVALRTHLDIARDLLAHGLVARNDVLATEVRLREIEDAAQAVTSRRAVAVRDLNRQLGRDPDEATTLPDSLPAPPPLPGARAALLVAGAADNPALRAAALRLAVDRTTADLARRAWRPSLYVGAAHDWQQNDILVHPHVNSLTAGVSWDIFDGGARGADVRQADARVVAAARDRLEVERGVAVAVDGAWSAFDQAGREERTARANVAAAGENLRIVEDQYRAGLARSGDVLDAEALLAASRSAVVTKHNATYRAQAALLAAAGRDLVAFYSGEQGR